MHFSHRELSFSDFGDRNFETANNYITLYLILLRRIEMLSRESVYKIKHCVSDTKLYYINLNDIKKSKFNSN